MGELLQREDERENEVWHTLSESIQRMKRMARVWRGHYPLVVRLMQSLVNLRVVQTSVDPIYEKVGEGHEKGDLYVIVKGEGGVGRSIVEFGVASDFAEKEGGHQDSYDGHGDQTLLDFETDLVFEVFGVGEGGVVEDEDVR